MQLRAGMISEQPFQRAQATKEPAALRALAQGRHVRKAPCTGTMSREVKRLQTAGILIAFRSVGERAPRAVVAHSSCLERTRLRLAAPVSPGRLAPGDAAGACTANVQRLDVVTFDEAAAAFPIEFAEVEFT
jgi:hypothetical protein